MRSLIFTTAMAMLAAPAMADDIALVLGNERYDRLERLLQADDVASGALGLSRQGVTVFSDTNADIDEMRDAAEGYLGAWNAAQTQVIVLSGRFATDGDRTWFLGRDVVGPTLFDVGRDALSVETMLNLLAKTPGRAVLVLGYDDGATGPLDTSLREGVGTLEVPQGVTVIHGRPNAVANLVSETIAEPGADLVRTVQRNRRLSAAGYVPRSLVVLQEDRTATADANDADRDAVLERQDRAAWDVARSVDTARSYGAYLSVYPDGLFADQAERLRREILSEPNRAARLAEEALNLSRNDRRAIQRDMSVLDFNTGGIDGIFGPTTRRSIANWQQQNGFSQTTYLTSDQITRLDAQAARRAQELEAEAERRRELEEARDRAYWEETGASRDEAGLRAYLNRYPDGMFSDRAEERLVQIEEAKRLRAREQDRAAWDQARSRNTVAAYRSYLQNNRDGSFRDEASDRIARLERDNDNADSQQAARAAEDALRLDPLTRRLIEARLQSLGLEPGQVDGEFNRATRRAIRRYQRDRDLDRTGFLNQATVARLLRDGFR